MFSISHSIKDSYICVHNFFYVCNWLIDSFVRSFYLMSTFVGYLMPVFFFGRFEYMFVSVYVCAHADTEIQVHTSAHAFVYIYVYIYICVCVCVCVCVWRERQRDRDRDLS